jgi:hypothetical protein
MAASSKHPGDIYLWIINVIESCENLSQLAIADKLIYIFNQRADNDWVKDMARALSIKSLIKSNELVSKTF